jgi:hypothetical protein
MFQNSFQNGTYFELYDPKSNIIIKILVAQDKLKNLFKITNVHGNNKVFDKDLKSIFFSILSLRSVVHIIYF